MKTVKVLALIAVVALAIPMANAQDSKNSLGVFVNYLIPSGDYSTSVEGGSFKLEADEAMGYGLSYRYQFNPKWDIGASLFYAEHDVTGSDPEGSGKVGTISWMPILFDANWHFFKGGMMYVGPTLGYAMWDKLEEEGGSGSIAIKDDFVYGINFGLDIPFGKNWAFNANARYLQVGAETDESGVENITVDVNPWLIGVGVSYKF